MRALRRPLANSMLQTAMACPLPMCSPLFSRLSRPAVRTERPVFTRTAHAGVPRRLPPVHASSGNASEDSSILSSIDAEGERQGASPPRNFLRRLAISLSRLLSGEASWPPVTPLTIEVLQLPSACTTLHCQAQTAACTTLHCQAQTAACLVTHVHVVPELVWAD